MGVRWPFVGVLSWGQRSPRAEIKRRTLQAGGEMLPMAPCGADGSLPGPGR